MISSYLILAVAIIGSSLDKWISRAFLKKKPLCNEYLLTGWDLQAQLLDLELQLR